MQDDKRNSGILVSWGIRFLKSAFFGGLVGGITFALVAPFLMPGITGAQAGAGILVDEPSIDVDFREGPIQTVERQNVTFPVKGDVYNYSISIKNTQNRLAEDVRITFYFKGCAIDRGFRAQNGAIYSEPGIRFGSANCAETVYIPDLAKGEEINLRYQIRATSPASYPLNMLVIGPDHYIAYSTEYRWNLNGMSFHESETVKLNHSDITL